MCQLGKLGVKTLESLKGHGGCFIVTITFVRFAYRRINVIAAQFVHANLAGFKLEIAMENADIFSGDFKQRIDHFIWQVIDGVAHRDGTFIAAQTDILVFPVAHNILVNLTQNWGILTINPIQLLVSPRTQVRVRGSYQAHQFTASHFFGLTFHFNFENVAVGD